MSSVTHQLPKPIQNPKHKLNFSPKIILEDTIFQIDGETWRKGRIEDKRFPKLQECPRQRKRKSIDNRYSSAYTAVNHEIPKLTDNTINGIEALN